MASVAPFIDSKEAGSDLRLRDQEVEKSLTAGLNDSHVCLAGAARKGDHRHCPRMRHARGAQLGETGIGTEDPVTKEMNLGQRRAVNDLFMVERDLAADAATGPLSGRARKRASEDALLGGLANLVRGGKCK